MVNHDLNNSSLLSKELGSSGPEWIKAKHKEVQSSSERH